MTSFATFKIDGDSLDISWRKGEVGNFSIKAGKDSVKGYLYFKLSQDGDGLARVPLRFWVNFRH